VPVQSILEHTFYTTVELVSGVALIFFIGLYYAADPGIYHRGVALLVPRDRQERTSRLLNRIERTLWRWLIARSIIMLTTGLFCGLALALIGAPLPLVLGIIAGLLAFVPTIGPIVATIPAVLVAIPAGGNMVVWVLCLYIGIQALEANLLTPVIEQFQVHVPPIVLLSAQLLMFILTGSLGMALASPLCATGLVLVRQLYVKDVLGHKLNDDVDQD
jgi:predicted PurR-regulated permease PerM